MTVKTAAQIKADAELYLPNQSRRLISPEDIRERIKDIADSIPSIAGAGSSYIDVREYGVSTAANASVNDAALAQAIDDAKAAKNFLIVPGSGYAISTIDLEGVRLIGTSLDQFGAACTFVSEAGDGEYAIALNDGTLECISVRCDGGNGIDAALVLKKTALQDVSVHSASVRANSVGISFGSDGDPGTQAITCEFNRVAARNFDTCFWMRFYANANNYNKLYALNTLSGAGNQSAVGFKIQCQGGHFSGLTVESNFVDAVRLESDSYCNLLDVPWVEGANTNYIRVNGVSNEVKVPFYTANILIETPHSRVIGRRQTAGIPFDAFWQQGGNAIQNSAFVNGSTGWTIAAGTAAVSSANKIWGRNTLELTSSAGGAVEAIYDVSDARFIQKAIGKPVTVALVGLMVKAGGDAVPRIMYELNSSGTFTHGSITNAISESAAGLVRATILIPTGTTKIRLRILGAGNDAETLIARVALPTMFIGTDFHDVEPQRLTDAQAQMYGPLIGSPFATFTDQDATPDVSGGNNFKASDTQATTTTALDGGTNGQTIKIIFTNNLRTFDFTGTTLHGNGGVDWTPEADDHMTCVCDGAEWFCDVSDNSA